MFLLPLAFLAVAAGPKVPDGFTITKVAGPPLVDRPITAAFDEKGRLYVADSSGSNLPPAKQLENPTHRIVRLEDTDGDGTFDKRTIYADKVMFPAGTMWLAGSLYVAAPPHIVKFTDTDGDGVADKREIWFDGGTLTGCANDLHGPYPGPDGFIYWTKGAFAQQQHTVAGKKFVTKAAHIFRARPDGSRLETVMTGGMDNPVDVVFTASGERIFNTTFLQHPGNGRRDGLIHAVYGGIYGKDHGPVREHIHTSPNLMPVLTHLGPAAPSGLHRYDGPMFGPEYAGNLFCTQFNLHTVSRHILKPKGATFETVDSPFVTSDDPDFHPTDVIEDADGSLLVIDTGGWYKLCCPSSQLVKAEVLGGIYRVTRNGANRLDVKGERYVRNQVEKIRRTSDRVSPSEYVHLMQLPYSPQFRRDMADILALSEDAVPHLTTAGTNTLDEIVALTALGALTRMNNAEARTAVREKFLTHPMPNVRCAAIHSVSLWRDKEAGPQLQKFVAIGSPHEARAAAEALGRLGDPAAVPNLIAAIAKTNDPVLDHSLTYALIEIGNADAIRPHLMHDSPKVRRSVLIALEQIPAGKPTSPLNALEQRPGSTLTADEGTRELDATDAALRDTAWWVAVRHPEWANRLVGVLQKKLTANPETVSSEWIDRAAKLADTPAVKAMLGERAASHPVLAAMAASKLKQLPSEWVPGLATALTTDEKTAKAAFGVLRAVPSAPGDRITLDRTVTMIQLNQRQFPEQPKWMKSAEYRLLSDLTLREPDTGFAALKASYDEPAAERALAIEVLSRSKPTDESLEFIALGLPRSSPLDRSRLIALFARSTSESVGTALLKSLDTDAVRPSLRTEELKPILAKYPPSVQALAAKLYAKLDAARAGERDRLDAIQKELPAGDIQRGHLVFNSAKAACIACHQMGYVGGKIGPDLTRVGGIRTERDLLESIVFPSASFVRSYEPVKVTTTDGRVFNGTVSSESASEVVLTIAADKQVRLPRADIETMGPGTISVMPAGLEQQISRQELADLVAFLKAAK